MKKILYIAFLTLVTASPEMILADNSPRISRIDGTSPITDVSWQPPTSEERRAALVAEIARKQRERDYLLSRQKDPSSDEAVQDQKKADAILRKITKMQSELLKLPAQ